MKHPDPSDPSFAAATRAFENASTAGPTVEHYLLQLFISGSTPTSSRAIENIKRICEEKLNGHYDLEVIDIHQHPEQAAPEHIVVTPTLVKKLPLPLRKIIGDLSDTDRVLVGLELIPRKQQQGK